MKDNCWQFNNCSNEPYADEIKDMSDCPVLSAEWFDGLNGGQNGGRYCWRVAGAKCIVCGGADMPNWANLKRECLQCEFFNKVRTEEGSDFKM